MFFSRTSASRRKKTGGREGKFADDLNAFKEFESRANNATLMEAIDECQSSLHSWGRASQVAFDAGKEGKRIISRTRPQGEQFQLLGILFDCKLLLEETVHDLVSRCRWKLRTLLQSQRHFDATSLIKLYKSRLLGFIEYRTSAIFHA